MLCQCDDEVVGDFVRSDFAPRDYGHIHGCVETLTYPYAYQVDFDFPVILLVALCCLASSFQDKCRCEQNNDRLGGVAF
ncbi:hypothetical protein Dimus_006219 [Dionaea muscipula]